MRLGAAVDDDASNIFTADASGDGADDDGVTFPTLTAGSTGQITISVTGSGRLSAWFDWNGDGDFLDTGERMMVNLTDNGGSDLNPATGIMVVNVAVPTTAVSSTFARFRWNAANLTSPTAAGGNGEVEDYRVTIVSNDRGDAPASYGDPTHAIRAGYMMGATALDANPSTVHSTGATGDDSSGNDDEDVISSSPSFTPNFRTNLAVPVSGAGGYLQAFIDWNKDGDFNDPGEQVAVNVQDNGPGDTNSATGTITISILTPNGVTAGTAFMRLRWSTTSGLGPTGAASDGEVEDHQITISAYLAPTGSTSCTGTNLTSNGSVELPDLNTSPPSFYFVSPVPGWSNTAESVIEIWNTGFNGVPAHTGNQLMEMNANVLGILQTTVNIQPYSEYTAWWAHRGRSGVDTARLDLTNNGGGSVTSGSFSTGNTAWVVRNLTGTGNATSTTATLSFVALGSTGGASFGNFIDTVEVCQTYLTLAKSFVGRTDSDGDGIDSAGDLLNYQFAVSNPSGNHKSLSSVQVIDDKIGTINVATPSSGDANSNGQLDAGETWIVEASYAVTQADIEAGSVTNVARAEAATNLNILRSPDDDVTVPLASTPRIELVKSYVFIVDSGQAGVADVGDVIRYSYAVSNTGNRTIANVTVDDSANNHTGAFGTTPGNAALTDNSPAGDSSGAPGSAVWASLAPKDVVTFTQDYTVTQTDIDTLQ
jgi:hypothetical protein